MVRTRYIGSPRPREAGFSATHMQDFNSHVTGGDWIHPASNISVTGVFGNVQAELDEIQSEISAILPEAVVNPSTSVANAITIFTDTSGKVIGESRYPTSLDPVFGDLIMPDMGAGFLGFNMIKPKDVNLPSVKGQALWITGQDNAAGPGGDLMLFGGFNGISGLYDGFIVLSTPSLMFSDSVTNPTITQNSAASVNDLFIVSQTNTSPGTPSNLWLESGVNSIGQAGDINLRTYPGIVNLLSSGLRFDKDYAASIIQSDNDVSVATDMVIIAQSITSGAVNFPNGTPGNLWLSSGYNSNNETAGNIHLQSYPGGIYFGGNILSNITFDPTTLSPFLYQPDTSVASAGGQPLTIQAQNSFTGLGGDLWLTSGFSYNYSGDGNVNLNANLGNVNVYGGALLMTESAGVPMTVPAGVYLYVSGGVLYAKGSDLVPHALGIGDVVLSPTVITQNNAIDFVLHNTGGYVPILDTIGDGVVWGWPGVLKDDIIRGNVYFKINVTSGTILLNIRIYEDLTNVANFTLQIAATALEYVTIPIYWKALSSPGELSVQVWGAAGISDNAILTQMFISNNNWGDFEFIRK